MKTAKIFKWVGFGVILFLLISCGSPIPVFTGKLASATWMGGWHCGWILSFEDGTICLVPNTVFLRIPDSGWKIGQIYTKYDNGNWKEGK